MGKNRVAHYLDTGEIMTAPSMKAKKAAIDKQFEYNTYIRDFFANNKGKTLEDAIKCWKYKKSLQGHNRYEASDLIALSENTDDFV